jgi:hypothetical protein
MRDDSSYKSVQRLRKDFGLKGTIQQGATFETLEQIYEVLRGRFPTWELVVWSQQFEQIIQLKFLSMWPLLLSLSKSC